MIAFESLTTIRFPSTTPRNRLLAHFADVRAREADALLFALNLFLLLGGYYLLRTVREADSFRRRRRGTSDAS